MRGANSDGTLLLIDGMRYGSASFGGPVFYNLPLEQIDHIELVRGPLSALYGSDAAGGVIQIFTRHGEAGSQASAAATVGSQAYHALDAGVRGAQGGFDYAIQAGGQRTDGYPYTNANLGIYANPNRDGFSQTSASANLGYRWASGWQLRVQGLGARSDADFSDGYDPTQASLTARNRFATSSVTTSLQGAPIAGWSTTLRFGDARDNDDTDVATSPYTLGRYTTQQTQISWQNDVDTPLGSLLVGVEHLRQSVSSDVTNYLVDTRTVNSALLGLTGKRGAHSWQVDGRRDANSQFGHVGTGAMAYGYAFAPDWRVSVSAGTSFVAPSFNDLYYPGYSNPALRAQRGISDELALQWATGVNRLRLALYQSQYRDLIAYAGPTFLPVNVGRAKILGATLEGAAGFGPVAFSASLDSINPRDETDATQLTRRARNTASLMADWTLAPQWVLGARLQAAGMRYDDALNQTPLGGYGLWSAHAQWRFFPHWQVALRGDNLSNHSVQPAYGYNAPPRQWFLTLRYGGL
jgi:vitamin B12 transporter